MTSKPHEGPALGQFPGRLKNHLRNLRHRWKRQLHPLASPPPPPLNSPLPPPSPPASIDYVCVSAQSMDRLTKVHTGFGRLNFDSIVRSGSSSARSPSSNSPSQNVGSHSLSNGPTIASPISMSRTTSSGRVNIGDQNSLGNINMGGSGAGDQVGSFRDTNSNPPIDLASRRRSAIAFDPQVKADGGAHFPLQAPLPRPIRTDLSKEGYFENRQLPTRSFTWSEQDTHRSSRGEVDGNGVGNGNGRIYERRAIGQFLSPTSYGSPEPERVASLTSDFTLSPISDEFHTPPPRPDAFGEFCTSPFAGSPLTDRLQQGGSPMWPSRSLTHSGRNKSYTFETRSRSRSSRAQSDRSASPRYGGSNQLSPANMVCFGACLDVWDC